MKKAALLIVSLIVLLAVPLNALADATSFEYKDEKTNTVFIVPAGWSEVDKATLKTDADCLYVHRNTEKDFEEAEVEEDAEEEDEKMFVPYISYSSKDIGSAQAKSREDVNFDSFSKKDLAEMLKISEDELSFATYNRQSYYRFETDANKFTQALEEGQRVTGYVTVKNGYLYTFLFFDNTDSKVYDDFKTFMGSVIIEGKVPDKPERGKLLTPAKLAALGITGIAVIAFAVVLIKTKKK